jgi:hypothetical protein
MIDRSSPPALRRQTFQMKGFFEMNKFIIGAAALAVMVAATIVWSKSLVVEPHATPTAKSQQASVVSSGTELTANPDAFDRDYGWGPFRTVDW